MKKLLLVLLVSAMCVSVNAQSFDGIKIDGSLPSIVQKYRLKGYVLVKYIENGAVMNGKVAGQKVELYLATTPKTKLVCRATVYLPVDNDWYSLKSDYRKYVSLFSEKHGEPDDSFEFFKSPYYEGDGYEISALRTEKVVYSSYWMHRNNLTAGVSISKYRQIEFTYENDKNMEIKEREESSIESLSF